MRYLDQICSLYSVVIKIFITLHFRYTMWTDKILLNEPFTKWLLLERRHSGLLKLNRFCRLGETSELSMEEIIQIHQFVQEIYRDRYSVR